MALQRSDLEDVDLRPGDVIDYYSQMYAWGEDRGRKRAIVVGINDADDYPVRVNSGEIVHKYSMIRRLECGEPGATGTPWRKVRTFNLVNGTYEARSGRHLLSSMLRDAVMAVLSEQGGGDVAPASAESAQACSSDRRSNFNVGQSECGGFMAVNQVPLDQVIDGVYEREQLQCFEDIPTASQLRKRHHQANPKNTHGWGGGRSRKKKHRKMRVEHRSSTQMYNSKSTKSLFLQRFIARPETQAALRALRAARGHVRCEEVATTDDSRNDAHASATDQYAAETVGDESPLSALQDRNDSSGDRSGQLPDFDNGDGSSMIIDRGQEPLGRSVAPVEASRASRSCTREPAEWPADVIRIYSAMKPRSIQFRNIGRQPRCECKFLCYVDECHNSQGDIYCTPDNCGAGGRCGNALDEHPSLSLFRSHGCGLGVYSTIGIDCGVIVAEYAGEIVAYEGVEPGEEANARMKVNSGYTYLMSYKAMNGKYVYIEPAAAGSIARFINHSCDANCEFRELKYMDEIRVAVLTRRYISPNEELTVRYGNDTWFKCNCESPNCVSKNADHIDNSE
jgi:hypothetical protein